MRHILLAVFIVIFSQNSFANNKAEVFTLSNGMVAVAIPNNKVAAVSHMVWYKTGGIDEKPGKGGIAHFLEHLMFKGTEKFPKGEFLKIIAQNGGNDNAFTSKDYTAYYQNIAKDKLELVMDLESDRMKSVNFTELDVETERNVVIEERFSRTDSNPSSLLREQMNSALFLNHPYGSPLIGWQHEIKSLNYQDAKNWYDEYYNPSNAILIVSGDITKDELQKLAEKYYGKIKAGKPNVRNIIFEPEHNAARQIVLKHEKVINPQFYRYYIAPSINYGESKHTYALTLLSHLLTGSRTSALYKSLVIEKNLVTSVSGYYEDLNIGPSVFSITAEPSDGKTIKQVQNKIDREIDKIKQNGFDEKTINRAKNSLVSSMIYANEDLKTMAYVYGQVLSVGVDASYVDDWAKNINAVTNEQIIAAANYVLKPENSVTGHLLPKDKK